MGALSSTLTVTVAAKESKSKVVHARFGSSEMLQISKAADEAGLTVSAFMRSLTLEGAGVRPFFTEADRAILHLLLSEMRALGVNLNQLARAANRREAVGAADVKSTIEDVHQAVAAVLIELRAFAERGAQTRRGKV